MTYKLTNTSQPADPYYGAVSLLLHGDGANGSTEILDSSVNPKTVTAVGNARISTAQSKFGGASMYFDGSGDKASLSASPEWVFGIQDFTIEAWMYLMNGGQSYARLMHFGPFWLNDNAWGINAYDADFPGKLTFASFKLGGRLCVSTSTIALNTWYHIAVTRQNGVFRLFVNGILESTNSSYISDTIEPVGATTNTFTVGSSATTSGDEDMQGYIDDLRITKGVARYTSSFTPPSQPFLNALKVPIITDGLVYNLDVDTYPGSGTTLSDLSGNGNTGILQNAPTYVDVYGGSLYFDGTNEWVSGTVYDIATDYSFSIWLKLDTLSITHYLISGSVAFTGNYNIILTTSGIVAVASRGNPVVPFSEFTASIDTIYQIVVTKSGTSYNLYVNGSNVSSKTYNNSFLTYSPNRLFANEFSNGLFKGSLYRTSGYNKALTAAEVQQNFNALRSRFGI